MLGYGVGPFEFFGAEETGEERVDADAGPGRDRDHDGLHRKNERDSRKRVFADSGNVHAVYNIIECLNHHGDDDGKGHPEQKSSDRKHAHFVFRGFCCIF